MDNKLYTEAALLEVILYICIAVLMVTLLAKPLIKAYKDTKEKKIEYYNEVVSYGEQLY